MRTISLRFPPVGSGSPKAHTIETNLYDLIETIHDEVQAGEDRVVVQAVLDLMERGRMKFIRTRKGDGPGKGRKTLDEVGS